MKNQLTSITKGNKTLRPPATYSDTSVPTFGKVSKLQGVMSRCAGIFSTSFLCSTWLTCKWTILDFCFVLFWLNAFIILCYTECCGDKFSKNGFTGEQFSEIPACFRVLFLNSNYHSSAVLSHLLSIIIFSM